jgi:ATP-binding cassette subfamily A (ABC1) protein 5
VEVDGEARHSDRQLLDGDIVCREEDRDVVEEQKRVDALDADISAAADQVPPLLLVQNLHVEYRRSKTSSKAAVSQASFAVNAGEIFGLLGPNGAGKSTMLNAVIAEKLPTSGKVVIAGHEIRDRSLSDAVHELGFCPQEDALWPLLTLEEHLECYAVLRGVQKDKIKPLIDEMISALKVTESRKKWVANLSGGTKRKLMFMMSMLGSPRVVLLDEPSTGLDPLSRKLFWDMVRSMFSGISQRCCVLTTHHMEEANVLCSRLAIMVNGKLECIGSTQHLKNVHGTGYILELDLMPSQATGQGYTSEDDKYNVAPVAEVVAGATCIEHFGTHVMYHVPQTSVEHLSTIFVALERWKQQSIIREYGFSQSTLEQVFLQMARLQKEDS